MKTINNKLVNGICYISIGKSNLIFSITDLEGNQLIWLRPASLRFRGSKQRFSVFAMEQTIYRLVKQLMVLKLLELHIVFSGLFRKWIGKGIVEAFRSRQIRLLSFKYRIARPHGMMRTKKKRRL
jgi:ribosomal protein S11